MRCSLVGGLKRAKDHMMKVRAAAGAEQPGHAHPTLSTLGLAFAVGVARGVRHEIGMARNDEKLTTKTRGNAQLVHVGKGAKASRMASALVFTTG